MVVLLGFEPRQTESESAVLPLHHRTIGLQKYSFISTFAIVKTEKSSIEIKKWCPNFSVTIIR